MSDTQTATTQDEGFASRFLHLFFASKEKDSNDKLKGIPNLEVTLEGGGQTYKLRTGSGGELPVVKFSGQKVNCKVTVTLPNKNEEDLGEITLDQEDNAHTFISPYTVKKAVMERHTGTPPKKADKPASTKKKPGEKLTVEDIKNAKRIGETDLSLSENAHPVMLLAEDGECCDKANTRNLKLGDNVIYRDFINAAADRSKIIPQAIAALIGVEAAPESLTVHLTTPAKKMTDAEAQAIKAAEAKDAATDKKEREEIDASKRDTSPKGKKETKRLEKLAKNNAAAREKARNEAAAKRIKRDQPVVVEKAFSIWNPWSKNPLSSASGLTQFVDGTWMEYATKKGSYLSEAAIHDTKCVVEKPNPPTTEKRLKPLTEAEKKQNEEITAFNKKNSKAKHKSLIKPKYETITVPGKGTHLKIIDEAKLLAMRFDPKTSIMTSVDYAVDNLKQLSNLYPPIKDMPDGNKAKLMYLAHHLGMGNCTKFIEAKIKDDEWPKNADGTPKVYTKGKHAGEPIHIVGAETLLTKQVGAAVAEDLYGKSGNNWILAHRRWLIKKINDDVNITKFACDASKVTEPDSLFDIIKTIGGKHPEGFSG